MDRISRPFRLVAVFAMSVLAFASGVFAVNCNELCQDTVGCELRFVVNEWKCYKYVPDQCRVLWTTVGDPVECADWTGFVDVSLCEECGNVCDDEHHNEISFGCDECVFTATIPQKKCNSNPGS